MVVHFEQVFRPTSLADAVALLQQYPQARPVAGATDVTVELQRRPAPDTVLVDLTAVAGLHARHIDEHVLEIGALTTHADVLADPLISRLVPALCLASAEVGAAQIRNRATVVGNLATASPANDTITPLIALDAELLLVGPVGERSVRLEHFYRGVRQTVLQPAELIRAVRIPLNRPYSTFLKLGLRAAQAIAVVNVAIAWAIDTQGRIRLPRVTLGAVGPTIVRATAAETLLEGMLPAAVAVDAVAAAAAAAARPIDDVRAPARYRRAAVYALIVRALAQLLSPPTVPHVLPLLRTPRPPELTVPAARPAAASVTATVNGRDVQLDRQSTLLAALRSAGLPGSKEGCGEGECGACTVWLNGAAVMACLTPAAQAEGADVVTVEAGLQGNPTVHQLQHAFAAAGAVQCGFCIPGMIMSAAKLLDEIAEPSEQQIRSAVSGNICRCTGYRKIIEAVQTVAAQRRDCADTGRAQD
jgi:xanthine dehydrogenase iron-sulfur cluster and FAD-binding subunit A